MASPRQPRQSNPARSRRRPERILVVAGSGMGHVLPHLAVAAQLRQEGHEVVVFAERSAASMVRQAGCQLWLSQGEESARLSQCRTAEGLIRVLSEFAAAASQELLTGLRRQRFDRLLINALHLGGALAATASQLPWASLATTPMMLHASRARSIHAHIPTRRIRRALGLSPLESSSAHQAISPHLYLLPWSPHFDAGKKPGQAHHVGPLSWDSPPRGIPGWVDQVGAHRPLVLAGMSTTPVTYAREDVLRYLACTLEALNDLPVDAVMTLPDSRYRVPVPPARHVRLTSFLPHQLLMPRAQVLITHGGWGTLGRAFREGVPVLTAPAALDQPLNARLARRAGVGLVLGPDQLNAVTMRRKLLQLLLPGSPERRRAAALARALVRLGGAEEAARRLMSL